MIAQLLLSVSFPEYVLGGLLIWIVGLLIWQHFAGGPISDERYREFFGQTTKREAGDKLKRKYKKR